MRPFYLILLGAVFFAGGCAAGSGGSNESAALASSTPVQATTIEPAPTITAESTGVEAAPTVASEVAAGYFDVPLARELSSRVGGWGYVHAAPFGAVEPGENQELDAFWASCRDGNGGACEDLYQLAYDSWNSFYSTDDPFGEVYVNFGATCGGRRLGMTEPCTVLLPGQRSFDEVLHDRVFYVPDRAPQILPSELVGQRLDIRIVPGPDTAPPGTFPEFDPAWQACADGDPAACDSLDDDVQGPLVDSGAYWMFGRTCGGRTAVEMQCEVVLAADDRRVAAGSSAPGLIEWLDGPFEACGAGDSLACYRMQRDTKDALFLATEPVEDVWPYFYYAFTCGGRDDRPILAPACVDYAAWPVVDEVDTLPVPPDF